MTKEINSLYIHIPFCEHLCDYCDFTKLQYFRIFAEPYINKLIDELNSYNINKSLKTIYIGGGTPTALEDDLFEKLLVEVSKYTSNIEEYTVECNPESLSETKLALMKKYGVNRLSIGVESTNDEILKSINRPHTFKDVQLAVSKAKSFGFDNLNVDLILGLPNVTKSLLKKDLENILTLGVQHISCYSLTVHPNTVFGINGIDEPVEDFARDMYDMVNEILESNGFEHYEISNWSLIGKNSKHNLTYWKDEQYYGIGLGASGYISDVRYTNTKSINAYLEGKTVAESEKVTVEDDKEYFIMLNLRTKYGILFNEFESRFKDEFFDVYKTKLVELEKQGLIQIKEDSVTPTYEGMMVLDQIVLKILEEK